jgi:probable addiction module antidote protein
MIGRECVVLLCSGDKRKQSANIDRALERLKDYKDKDGNLMKRKASISHDEAIIRRLRKDPDFAAQYVKAALEDKDEPRVLLSALRHLAQAQGIAKVAMAAGIERESLYRALSIHGNPRLSRISQAQILLGALCPVPLRLSAVFGPLRLTSGRREKHANDSSPLNSKGEFGDTARESSS